MKSKTNSNSQERITKATELLQKFWWLSWFLVIAPLIVAITSFFILNLFQVGFYIALSLSVVSFMFALLFFYKAFDKYREKPFFLNKQNNLNARIHILFLIPILSFIVTPIFILISQIIYPFVLLPLISYIILYNIIYYYYYYQPIDLFDLKEREFKHVGNLKLSLRQPYNILIIINYIFHIIFLAFTAETNFSWLYALVTNLLFYGITLVSTRKQIKDIKEDIVQEKPILQGLTSFKQRFVNSIVGLVFITLILMPSITIITLILSGVYFFSLEVINGTFLIIIFILFYFKSRLYVGYYYSSKLQLYEEPVKDKDDKKSPPLRGSKYQKSNSYLSSILILLITLFSFLINNPILILIILPFLYIFFYYEQKAELCPKKYNRYVLLLNSLAILISITFGLIPLTLTTILLNLLIISLSLYFILQIFVKFDYFIKESILVYQNLLAVASISLIVYLFFPIAIFGYTTFTSDPILILISNILLHTLLLSIIFLISQYALGFRYFYNKSPKSFRIWLSLNFIIVELAIYSFIFFRLYFIFNLFTFLQSLLISSILFPLLFIIFLFINFKFQIFPLGTYIINSYFFVWATMLDLFIILLVFFLLNFNFIILASNFLISSIFYYYVLKFGSKLGRVEEPKLKKRVKINSYFLTIELLYLFFNIFFTAFQALTLFDNIIYSIYLSLALVCGLINLLSKKGIFSEDLYIKINVFILLYSAIIAFYLFLMITLRTYYVFIIPLMISSIIFELPILYLKRKRLYPNLTSKSLKVNSYLLSLTLSLIPTIIGLDLFYLGLYFDLIFLIMTVINFTLYILFGILTIYYYLTRKASDNEKQGKLFLKMQILIAFCISFTTIFYYSFFLLIATTFYIILPLIFAFSFLFVPLYYSYTKEIFSLKSIKSVILANTMILTIFFIIIPSLIGLFLISQGFLFDFNLYLLNILNSSIYIFYVFLIILTGLSKKFKLKDNFIKVLNQLQFITVFVISITTIFFYPFLFLFGTFYGYFIPLIALLLSWFLLFYFSYKREYFNLELIKKFTIYNFIGLSCLIILLPSVIGLELTRIGLRANIILIITLTTLLLFSFLKTSEILSKKIRLKEKYIKIFEISNLLTWFAFSLLLPYYISSTFIIRLDLSPITFLIISGSLFMFFLLSVYTLYLVTNCFPKLSHLNKYQDVIIYGIDLSVSLLFTFLGLSTGLFIILIPELLLIQVSIIIGFFFVVFLLFLIFCDNIIELKLTQSKIILELTAWLVIKILLCILLYSLIDIFVFQFFVFNKVLLFSLTFTLFTPLSLSLLKNLKYISSKNQFLLKRITLIVFILSLLSLNLEIVINLAALIPILYQNAPFHVSTIIVNLILIFYYFILKFNKTAEEESVFKIYTFYILLILLFLSLLYFSSILSIFLIIISYSIILSKRTTIPILRFLSYFLLSYFTFTEIIVILSAYGVIVGFDIAFTGIFILIYLLSMSLVLLFSILLNIKRNNVLEKYTLYSLISLLSFVSLMTFTNIQILYNVTISLFIFLLFTGISFYRKKDQRYKWFINPCV
ncbi:MAG: hypothetical protein ACFE9N_12375, partial [Promethearchaeota archaeon]